MPNVIQQNAAKIVALSTLLFTGAAVALSNKPLAPESESSLHDSQMEPNNALITLNLAAA